MLRVRDGLSHFGTTLEKRFAGPRGQRARAASLGVTVPPMDVLADAPVAARCEANRWIIDCPDCGSAEFAWWNEPVFMCTECWNGAVGYRWRRVSFPPNREAIENALMVRPVPRSRDWKPGETVGDLRRENRKEKLPASIPKKGSP